MQEQIIYKKLIKIYINILKPSLKKIQNTGIKKDGKIDAEEQLQWNQHDQHILYSLHGHWLVVHVLILVLNWDSSVSSLGDWSISSQILRAKEERLSIP